MAVDGISQRRLSRGDSSHETVQRPQIVTQVIQKTSMALIRNTASSHGTMDKKTSGAIFYTLPNELVFNIFSFLLPH